MKAHKHVGVGAGEGGLCVSRKYKPADTSTCAKAEMEHGRGEGSTVERVGSRKLCEEQVMQLQTDGKDPRGPGMNADIHAVTVLIVSLRAALWFAFCCCDTNK